MQGLDDDFEDHFLMFLNIEKFSELNLKRPTLSLGKDGKETLQDQLKRVLLEGPEFGVFSVVCASSLRSLENCIDKKSLEQFLITATGPLEMMDSNKLMNSSAAAKLGNNEWMVFYDENNPNEYPVFRTYQKPDIEWIKSVIGGVE